MINLTFMHAGCLVVQISKAEALKRWNSNRTVFFHPSNLAPVNPWQSAYPTKKEEATEKDFRSFCNSFRFYNCDNERGNYIRFFGYELKNPEISFFMDNCQYVQHITREGYYPPIIGVGHDHRSAFEDAIDQFDFSYDTPEDMPNPDTHADPVFPGRNLSFRHYMSKADFKEFRECEDSDIYIYCRIDFKR